MSRGYNVKLSIFHHDKRSVLLLQGQDRYSFLQGIMTNDIGLLTSQSALYSSLLTPQGKFLFDFFLYEQGDTLFLECLEEVKEKLHQTLLRYKLRSQITLRDGSENYTVYSIHHPDIIAKMREDKTVIISLDPRHASLGYRVLVSKEREKDLFGDTNKFDQLEDYDYLRLTLGIPEALKEMIPDKSIPLECGLDQLHAISWDKGCYLGQELTARTRYRGLVRRRLLPVQINGEIIDGMDLSIFHGDHKVGTLCSHQKSIGIARLRIEDIQESLMGNSSLTCQSAQVKPYVPDWLKI